MLPDTGERYMSTPLFESISEEMDAEEMALSGSTPSCRFDAAPVCAVQPRKESSPVLDPEAETFVNEIVRNNFV